MSRIGIARGEVMAKSKSKPKSKKELDDEEEVVDAVAEDADASSEEVVIDEDASSEEVVIDEDASSAEVVIDEDASSAEILIDDDASSAEVAIDEDASSAEVAIDEDASSAEVDVDVDADDESPQSKKAAADDDDDDDDKDDDTEADDTPKPPTPKITTTTYILLGTNLPAAIFFVVMLFFAHATHEQYNHRTILNFLRAEGIPLEAEDTPASLHAETRPVLRLNSEQLKAAFSSRKSGGSASEPFVPIEEPIVIHIRPRDMTDVLVKDLFGDVGNGVKTQDDEIKRLADSLPGTIETAAKDVASKAKDKRAAIKKLLLPIAWDVWQVKRLNDTLLAAKDNALDDMLLDAAQRRIYYDILAPLNIHRPGADGDYKIEKMSAIDSYVMEFKDGKVKVDGYKIDDLKGFLQQRLKAALSDKYDPAVHLGTRWPSDPKAMTRDNNERRQVIAFILFTLGQVQVEKQELVPKGLDRAQIVSGLNEFTSASVQFVLTQRILQQRIAEAIRVDREGWILTVKDATGKEEISRTNGFIDEYEAEVQRLIRIVESIETAQKRIADLTAQRDQFTKVYAQRDQQQKDTMKKLLDARKDTEKLTQDLRGLQQQMHAALIELSDAASRNFALEAQIRGIELDYISKSKGAK